MHKHTISKTCHINSWNKDEFSHPFDIVGTQQVSLTFSFEDVLALHAETTAYIQQQILKEISHEE